MYAILMRDCFGEGMLLTYTSLESAQHMARSIVVGTERFIDEPEHEPLNSYVDKYLLTVAVCHEDERLVVDKVIQSWHRTVCSERFDYVYHVGK